MKIIAIGGVAASMSAVSKIRRLNKDASITVYEKGDVLSYGACGMPYFISDEIKHAGNLVARTKAQFLEQGITVHTRHEVIHVDENRKIITVKNLETNEEVKDSFDKLIIGTGARAFIPNIPFHDLEHIHVLSEYEDAITIKDVSSTPRVRDVVIIGGGFIGIEMVEAFLKMNKTVTLIETSNQILNLFDEEISLQLQQHLESKGVHIRLNETVTTFTGSTSVERVVTDKGSYPADFVLLSTGVVPNTDFLHHSNIRLSDNKAILTNKFMQTNYPDIYAAGDCSMIYHQIKQQNVYLPMGHNANKQGRMIAEHICGKPVDFSGVLGTTAIKVVDMEAAKTGLTEKEAKVLGIPYKSETVTAKNHAGYYPNAEQVTAKIIYHAYTHKLLGAELVGGKGTVLRINVFVLAISQGLTPKELVYQDFAYAPPFAGVWDVISVVCNKVK